MGLRSLKRFFRSGAPSPEKEAATMATSRELQGKHDASADVSEIPSPESSGLATPEDEHIFELPHEKALRLTQSNAVAAPERTREAVVPPTASMPEVSHERERSHNVPSTNTMPDLPHQRASLPQQTESNTTAAPVPERTREDTASMAEVPQTSTNETPTQPREQAPRQQQTVSENTAIAAPESNRDDFVPPTPNIADVQHERGRSPPRPGADCKPGYIVPNLPASSYKEHPRPQQPKANNAASLDGPPERGVRTNLPSLSTNQSGDQKFAPVFDESPDRSEKPVNKPQHTPVERKDSASAQPATDTSGVLPLKISDKLRKLVPYATPLSIQDLDRCYALEEDCFSGRNYCTKEQLAYRLTHCSSYSVGIFISTTETSSPVATFAAARSPDSSQPKRRALLIGHIIATKTNNDRISLADLQIGGHRNDGNNLAINNLAVLFDFRTLGVFSLLMKEFVIRMHQAAVAEKLILLSRGPYIPMFQHMKFEYRGQSSVAIGEENWYDMALDFKSLGTPMSPSKYEPAEEEDDHEIKILRPTSRH